MKLRFKYSFTRARQAVTIMEMLVSATLLTVIIYSLYSVFDRVQRAFRSSTTQVDVLEGGRAAMELMAREVEQMQPTRMAGGTNFYFEDTAASPLTIQVPNGNNQVFQMKNLLFVTRPDTWRAVGYKLGAPEGPHLNPVNGIGTLYRFEFSCFRESSLTNRYSASLSDSNAFYRFMSVSAQPQPYTNDFQRVLDGVVHLDVHPVGKNGVQDEAQISGNSLLGTNVPTYVELELGVLEQHMIEKARAMPAGTTANFLGQQAGSIHLFRQRVSVPTGVK